MKQICAMLLALLIILGGSLSASADEADSLYQEQLEASGADTLFDSLPQQTRDLLSSLGITNLDVESYTALQPTRVMEALIQMFSQQMGGTFALCGVLLGAVLLGAFAESLRHTAEHGQTAVLMGRLGAVAVSASVLLPIGECFKQVATTTENVRVMMLSYVPTYAAVVFASGHPTLAASYSTVLLAGAECTAALVTQTALPLVMLSLAFATVGTLSHQNRLSSLSATAAKTAMWILGTTTALFTGLLSMQSFVSAASDSLTLRAAKMTIGNFVPIVGGALSEAFGTVTGCVQLLRSTLGMFGVLVTVVMVLPAFLRCLSWSIALWVCRMAADVLGVDSVSDVFSKVGLVIKVLMGILASCALFLIITTTLVTVVGR